MVILHEISSEIKSCFNTVTPITNSMVFMQVNGTKTTPESILKVFDYDTKCKFMTSCIIMNIFIGCLNSDIEFISGCIQYTTRNEILGMIDNDGKFYVEGLSPMTEFCLAMAPLVYTDDLKSNMNDTNKCKYVNKEEMFKATDNYNRGYETEYIAKCINPNDVYEIKKTLLY
ncbi:hypothetical protein fgpv_010 [Flamingopox virus FGPVKD09]|uniref:Uncharacterized protein n=1 Tax=Flamingopox virus FGPVKD09 TaxID=2059380 RepID=A0A2H4X219_9POXV|nr:hypothetical protein C1178_gp010 [Flamingopox virus FGPVKD09]AUD40117.1 hypothetical protein fgpv_010 [Flamingopox virus FGPVKD09]